MMPLASAKSVSVQYICDKVEGVRRYLERKARPALRRISHFRRDEIGVVFVVDFDADGGLAFR